MLQAILQAMLRAMFQAMLLICFKLCSRPCSIGPTKRGSHIRLLRCRHKACSKCLLALRCPPGYPWKPPRISSRTFKEVTQDAAPLPPSDTPGSPLAAFPRRSPRRHPRRSPRISPRRSTNGRRRRPRAYALSCARRLLTHA